MMSKNKKSFFASIASSWKINIIIVILIICLLGVLALAYIAGRHFEFAKRSEEVLRARLDAHKIYVYFKDIDTKIGDHKTITFPDKLRAQQLIRFNLGLRQHSRLAAKIERVYLSFPANTQVFTGGKGGAFWAPTGRVGVKEIFVIIDSELPSGADIDLPPIEAIFKHGGLYTLSSMISLKGREIVADSCTLEVMEAAGR